jgi:hypothetical protein
MSELVLEMPRLASHQTSRLARRTIALSLPLMAAVALFSPRPLAGQRVVTTAGWQEATVGSELERYLRILQLAGKSPVYPWSVRGFSPREIDSLAPTDSLHPWAARLSGAVPDSTHRLRVAILRPEVRLIYNSAFPWAQNDGVVWAGRGLTSAVQAGVQVRYGPLSLTLRPIVFRAENGAFPLLANGLAGERGFANGVAASTIDLPQRFGDGPYARIDPGESSLRLDLFGVALGVSTGSEIWGPVLGQPLILGAGGPGFSHAYIGTSSPVNVWVGRVHGRVLVGRLEQSAYSPAPADSGSRLAAGIVATFVPRWVPGLELGFTRFFHQRWPVGGLLLSDFLIPLQGFILSSSRFSRKYIPTDPNYTPQNQLASGFARWALPASGLEIYGEYARDDRNADLRDLLSEPDHISAYALGVVKLLHRSARSYSFFRAELTNGRITDLARLRDQAGLYVHVPIIQGHTNRGQLLGSPAAALGGAGWTIGLDKYGTDGRWTLEGTRLARPSGPYAEGAGSARGWDVSYAVRAERLLFRRGWDITAAVTGVFDLNRNFSRDAFNLRLDVGSRFGF